MNKIKFAFLGTTQFSYDILSTLIANQFIPKIVFTMPESFEISYAKKGKIKNYTYSSLDTICEQYNIPLYKIERGNKTLNDYESTLRALELDILLVMGWFYMIPQKIREITHFGAWGIHASLLPNYAGGAPLVWAIINGEKETGVTLFKLDNGVDDGDIIDQKKIIINDDDSIKDVYQKATEASKSILLKNLACFPNITFTPQIKEDIQIYPQRTPDDGELDLTQSATALYNFIRAQSPPYPGAFIKTVDGKKLIIEKASIQDIIVKEECPI